MSTERAPGLSTYSHCYFQVWRYYLLSNRPEVSDSDFKWTDMIARSNNELLANLGNFVNRALAFTVKQ